jgi:YD repeat-containing protein
MLSETNIPSGRERALVAGVRPLWKWSVFFLLFSFSIGLSFRKKPGARIIAPLQPPKLLADRISRPTWDGTYPYLVISLALPGSRSSKFHSSIQFEQPTLRHESPVNQFEVDLHLGAFILRQTDLFVPDIIPLALTRTYSVWHEYPTAFGTGATHPYDICQFGDNHPYTYADLHLEDWREIDFPRISEGTGYADAVYRHMETTSEFYNAQISWNGVGWTVQLHDGWRMLFPDSYHAKRCSQQAPLEISDGKGHRIQLQRDSARNLEKLISPSGRAISFQYDDAARIIEATDDSGNVRKYSYDSTGHLQTVADASHVLYRFEYQRLVRDPGYDPYLMTVVMDGEWNMLLQNSYRYGRVSAQKLADGEQYQYAYTYDSTRHNVVETDVTLPAGTTRKFFFEQGLPVKRR